MLLGTDISTYDLLTDLGEIQRAGVPVYLAPERAIRFLVQKVKYERSQRHLLKDAPAAGLSRSS